MLSLAYFSQIFLLIFAGMASGISSSAPIGPSNLWVVNAVLNPQKKSSLWGFILGVIVLDVLYAFIAFWGYFYLLDDPRIKFQMGLATSFGLVILGLLEFKNNRKAKPNSESQEKLPTQNPFFKKIKTLESTFLRDFFIGAFLCGSNPVFISFWILVADNIQAYGIVGLNTFKSIYVFFGIALGDLIWYQFFAKLIKKSESLFSYRLISGIRNVIALGLIAFGVVTFVKTLGEL